MNLILVEAAEVGDAGDVRFVDGRADHLRRVLRVTPGKDVRVGVIDGPHGTGIVTAVTEAAVVVRCAFEEATPARPDVDLLLALPRPKVMRRLWAQIAALGVGRIMLTNAERVERNYFDTHVLAADCYRPLLLEGLQQARDTRVPHVSISRQFKVLVEDDLDDLFPAERVLGGLRLVADPRAPQSMHGAIREHRAARTLLAIGPEGGWSRFEMDLLAAHGFHAVGMGPRTLRTDTACLALLTLVHDAMHTSRPKAAHPE